MKHLNIIMNYILRDIPIHLINLMTMLLPNHLIINRVRGSLMKPFFGRCGKGLQIGRGVIINNPGSLFIGEDCYISHYTYIQAKGGITLGNKVIIGPINVIASSDHIIKNKMVTNEGISEPIIVGEGTWCGANVVLTSGVDIGAGSIVTKSFGKQSKIGGVPAKVLG